MQYNSIERKTKDTEFYRKEILKEIEQYIAKQNDINNIIIMGNYNQDIIVGKIKEFFNKIKVRDIHQSYNLIPEKSLDRTYIGGSKCIDSIAAI